MDTEESRENSVNKQRAIDAEAVYEIRVMGQLDQTWSDWFDGFTLNYQDGVTLMVGRVADQAALMGLLIKIGQLNLQLLSLKRKEG